MRINVQLFFCLLSLWFDLLQCWRWYFTCREYALGDLILMWLCRISLAFTYLLLAWVFIDLLDVSFLGGFCSEFFFEGGGCCIITNCCFDVIWSKTGKLLIFGLTLIVETFFCFEMIAGLHINMVLNLVLSAKIAFVFSCSIFFHPCRHISFRDQAVVCHSLIPWLLPRFLGLNTALTPIERPIFLLSIGLKAAHPIVRIIGIHYCHDCRWILWQKWRILVRRTLRSSSCWHLWWCGNQRLLLFKSNLLLELWITIINGCPLRWQRRLFKRKFLHYN